MQPLFIQTLLDQPFLAHTWIYFLICFNVGLITSAIMSRFSRRFYFQGTVVQKFSMFDLQFPATPAAIPRLLTGIENLKDKGAASKKALRGNLYVDFLFMAGAYPSICLLCLHIAQKMHGGGHYFFFFLGLAQGLAWLFDISENIYILNKIRTKNESSYLAHSLYFAIVVIKWSLALIGTICASFAFLYFWIIGNYQASSLPYIGVFFGEIILLVLLSRLLKKKSK